MSDNNQSKWIPISEELPYHNEIVIVTTSEGYVKFGYLSNRDIWHTSMGSLWAESNMVIAWMRRPEPYKENLNE